MVEKVGHVGHLQVEKFQHKDELLAHCINDKFVLAPKDLFKWVESLLRLANRHHNRRRIQSVKN